MNFLFLIILLVAFTVLTIIIKNNRIPSHLGVTNGSLAQLPKTPNAVSSQTSDTRKKVDALPFDKTLTQSKSGIKTILSNFESINIVFESKNYIHAVSASKTMRFHDDIEFFFDERSKVIHFRSASRVGFSDMNVNKKRYELLRKEYMNNL